VTVSSFLPSKSAVKLLGIFVRHHVKFPNHQQLAKLRFQSFLLFEQSAEIRRIAQCFWFLTDRVCWYALFSFMQVV